MEVDHSFMKSDRWDEWRGIETDQKRVNVGEGSSS